MTREEAIRIFRKEIECLSHAKCEDCILEKVCDPAKTTPLDSEYIEAYGMAIQALSQEPTDTWSIKDVADTFKKHGLIGEQEPCDDAISREAVIMECIKYADHEYNVQLKKEVSETRKHDAQVIIYACDYFKTFVEKLPSVTQNPIECDDVISRQAAIDAMYALCDTGETLKENQWRDNPHIDAITDAIDNLPSVTQKCEKCAMNGSGSKYCDNCGQKSGKWILTIEDWNKWTCSKCGYVKRTDIHVNIGWKFCPNCGAKMEVEE